MIRKRRIPSISSDPKDDPQAEYPKKSTMKRWYQFFGITKTGDCPDVNLRDVLMELKWKSFLFLSPRTATLLIAMYYIISAIVVIILASVGYSVLTPTNMLKTERGNKEASEGDEVLLEGITSAKFMLITLIVAALISIASSAMLIHGTNQDKAMWVYIWINVHVVILVTHVVICFCNMFLELPDEQQKDASVTFTVTNIMLTLYFLLAVNNFYNEMSEQIPFGFFVDFPYHFLNRNYAGPSFNH